MKKWKFSLAAKLLGLHPVELKKRLIEKEVKFNVTEEDILRVTGLTKNTLTWAQKLQRSNFNNPILWAMNEAGWEEEDLEEYAEWLLKDDVEKIMSIVADSAPKSLTNFLAKMYATYAAEDEEFYKQWTEDTWINNLQDLKAHVDEMEEKMTSDAPIKESWSKEFIETALKAYLTSVTLSRGIGRPRRKRRRDGKP